MDYCFLTSINLSSGASLKQRGDRIAQSCWQCKRMLQHQGLRKNLDNGIGYTFAGNVRSRAGPRLNASGCYQLPGLKKLLR